MFPITSYKITPDLFGRTRWRSHTTRTTFTSQVA